MCQRSISVIKNSRPAWLIEVSGNPDDSNSPSYKLFKMLNEEGYDAYWFDG